MKLTNLLLFLAIVHIATAFIPDVSRNFTEIITSKNYPCETHTVQTSDGYLLTLFRIPFGQRSKTVGKPVLLFHGLLDSSFTWIVNMPSQSLPYILADAGYDVWMGNVRGNTYGLRHVKLTPKDKAFWDFTFDDFAEKDMPETIDYILKETGHSKLGYVGHSQGTQQMFSGLALNPKIADKVNVFVGLGPVTKISHMENIPIAVLADLHIDTIVNYFGFMEFLPTLEGVYKLVGEWFCEIEPVLCENVIELICGRHKGAFNATRMDVVVAHEPGGTSVKNMVHWAQLYRTKKWQMYDYGSISENEQHYGQPTPPEYDYSKIPKDLPIALVYGMKDLLADPTDVENLIQSLPSKPVLVKKIVPYAHLDFIWALDANVEVYTDILTLLTKYM